ncbi:NAD+ synthase [Heliophilum fasciatum]|uniref:Glutamine-dependent NAD(+) synthetase n=1 Tax=Heliophilum fasciatum TaxID=35700 RepID=A0A4R2RUY3_9FIRM|nr:NAD+ synthase [Heliophilum fasciatum]MCW2277183.1 NAD+ synthase (glutamine-hydrolyzing) [Heliophilum fasciatum]TCP68182.1 NAD+ synthase (glutamine-hydrolysing) [Heliophilum fasciatum]
MRITIAQLNPIVGDLTGNLTRAIAVYREAATTGSHLVVLPELYLVGYPPKDLLERTWMIDQVEEALQALARETSAFPDTALLIGAPVRTGSAHGKSLYNGAVLLQRGAVAGVQAKTLLPTYDVFDEARYFEPAPSIGLFACGGERLGIAVCEDAWNEPDFWPAGRMYSFDPVAELARQGATLLINLSASPFCQGKAQLRRKLMQNHARKHGLPLVYVNQIGGNDELIFDGGSMVINGGGALVHQSAFFQEEVVTIDLNAAVPLPETDHDDGDDDMASVHDALVLGIRDYMRKSGFSRAVVGLSGGLDSAVVLALAVAALGSEQVLGISMPSIYSSTGSVEDSRELAQNLNVPFQVLPIKAIQQQYLDALATSFAGLTPDATEENLQARIRGNLLMAFSNKFGHLLLSTGNKSEMAVGYCTLYGDMSGGLSVLADVLKTDVYRLAAYINREQPLIPMAIIAKAPSAELRPDQKDQDTLPPYPVLDAILQHYVEEGLSRDAIISKGFAEETVAWVIRTVDRNEYKRKQAAPGLKVTAKAFGIGRRMPLAARHSHDFTVMYESTSPVER